MVDFVWSSVALSIVVSRYTCYIYDLFYFDGTSLICLCCIVLLDLNKFDPERFHPPGLDFRGKLIGIEDVPDARGDKMCQVIFYC